MTRRAKPKVVDVNVTRDMIHYAVTQTSTLCAIALAMRDADIDGNFERPWVSQERIAITDRLTDQRYEWDAEQIPDTIKTWIDQFDRDPGKVRPFTFQLDLSQARVVPRQHTTAMQAVAKDKSNQQQKRKRETQARIPAAHRSGIRHTTKRELRDVEVPPDAGVISDGTARTRKRRAS